MEHLEQSVMWAGTNWMLKLLAVNLASTQQVSVGRHPCFVTTLETPTPPLIFPTESQALNGSDVGPWYGPVYLENVMCNGTERFGFQCSTPGPGVITSPECYNANRTAGVRCITGELNKGTDFLQLTE